MVVWVKTPIPTPYQIKMNTTTTKRYTPTATARPSWRDREAQKERTQREAARLAIEEAEQKKIALTEENFPSLTNTNKMTVHDGPTGKFAELANKMQVDKEIDRKMEEYRKAKSERERTTILNTVVYLSKRREYVDEEDDDYSYEEEVAPPTTPKENLAEKYPPHGKRGTCSAPDYEGWRTVLKKRRKQKRELTEAELVKKYREEFFNEETEEDKELNGQLADASQRRDFY